MSIDTTQFKSTNVIKSLKSKQDNPDDSLLELNEDNELLNEVTNESPAPVKSNRGRKKKYASDEERIIARRLQQKQYRERKKKELAELRALKAKLDAETQK